MKKHKATDSQRVRRILVGNGEPDSGVRESLSSLDVGAIDYAELTR